MFVLKKYQYEIDRVKKAILHHSKILPHQRCKNYTAFRSEDISYKYDEREREFAQTVYRGSFQPYLQDHHTLTNTINGKLGFMFNASRGRICIVCRERVGYFEQHPICIGFDHTLPTCDGDIIRSIHESKYQTHSNIHRQQISYIYIYFH